MSAEDPGSVPTPPRRRRSRWWWLAVLPILWIGLRVLSDVVYQNYRIPSGAMEPTIPAGSTGVGVLKCAYQVRVPFTTKRLFSVAAPQRGDVVVLRNPKVSGNRKAFIFRVVAVSGDTVEMQDETLLVNGARAPLALAPPSEINGERTLLATTRSGSIDHQVLIYPDRPALRTFAKETVPAGHVFVLGDNRDLSRDSRFQGPFPYVDLLGRVVSIPPA